jgi:hypothetical protein
LAATYNPPQRPLILGGEIRGYLLVQINSKTLKFSTMKNISKKEEGEKGKTDKSYAIKRL